MARGKGRKGRKSKKDVTLAAYGDLGTGFQIDDTEVVTRTEDNGQKFQIRQRVFELDRMLQAGQISKREHVAGGRLLDAHELTKTSPELAFTRVAVDCTPDPTAASANKADREREASKMEDMISKRRWPWVKSVCLDGKKIRALDKRTEPKEKEIRVHWREKKKIDRYISEGLGELADGLGL